MEACILQKSSVSAEPVSRVLAEAASKAQPKNVAQDGADADVSIQSHWQINAEAEAQTIAHCAAVPDEQVCSAASAHAYKDAAARQ